MRCDAVLCRSLPFATNKTVHGSRPRGFVHTLRRVSDTQRLAARLSSSEHIAKGQVAEIALIYSRLTCLTHSLRHRARVENRARRAIILTFLHIQTTGFSSLGHFGDS